MSDVVVLGFPDEAAARLAYDEVLNLADNDDLLLEALALRTSGPAGRICIEIPDQIAEGGNAARAQMVGFLTAILETKEGPLGSDRPPSEMYTAVRVTPAVIVFMASHIPWQRFRETMSVFADVTVAMPAST